MKAFQFPLEKVLAFRKQQWEAESAILAALLDKQQQFQQQAQREETALHDAAVALQATGPCESAHLRRYSLACDSGRRALKRLRLAVESVAAQIRQQQQVCLVAKRDYELVRKLREARWAAWCLEADREEESLSTEVFLAKRTQRRLAVSSRMESAPVAAETLTALAHASRADAFPASADPGSTPPHAAEPAPAAPAPDSPECPEASSPRNR